MISKTDCVLPQTNIMMTDDGRPCLADVGMNSRLFKIKYGDVRPIPSEWMFKAPEELSPRCDPPFFTATKEMDVYAFAGTVYSVSAGVVFMVFACVRSSSCIGLQIFTSKLPFPAKSYGRRVVEIISRGHVLEKPAEISDPLWSILKRCWSYNPGDRPSIAVIDEELAAI
jgi:serine/threonine protein kinase